MVKTAVKETLPLPVRVVVNEVEKAVDRSGGKMPSMPKLIKKDQEGFGRGEREERGGGRKRSELDGGMYRGPELDSVPTFWFCG